MNFAAARRADAPAETFAPMPQPEVDRTIDLAIGAGGKPEAVRQALAALVPALVAGWVRRNLVGLILLQAGDAAAALSWFEAALAAHATSPDVEVNRGVALQTLGRFEDAHGAFTKALAGGATDPSIFLNNGNVLRALGRNDEAERAVREAVRRRPAYAEALRTLGLLLADRGETDEALACLERALRQQPTNRDLLLDRGNVLQKAERAAAAVEAGLDALRRLPEDPVLLNNYGVALHQAGRMSDALAVYDRAIARDAGTAQALFNKGNVLLHLGRPQGALDSFEAVLRNSPHHADALCSRAVALKTLGRFDEAALAFDAALALDPDSAHVRNNRGALRLLRGDFARGWDDYEARWRAGAASGAKWRRLLPDWAGESPAGLRLLVLDEQGLGDVIQFVRYLPLLKMAGAEVTFLCRRSLHRLLAGLPLPINVVDDVQDGAPFDRQVALSSLPRLFRTDEESIPHMQAYLTPESSLAAAWAAKLGTGFKVGLCWQGNPDFRADPARSLPLDALRPLAALPGIRLVSLQHGAAAAATLPGLEHHAMPAETAGDAFVETAAAMAALDAVVTCDTSIAHLAGALGRPTFVLLKAVPDWRWMLKRADSPWYPSLALVRRELGEDWGPAVGQVAEALGFMRDAQRP